MRRPIEDFVLNIVFCCGFLLLGTLVFSISIPFILVSAVLILIFILLRDIGRKNTLKAVQIKENPHSYKGTKASAVKIALLISLQFYFCLFCLASVPVKSPLVWIFIVLAMFLFSLPLHMISGFCKEMRIQSITFWSIQLLLQISVVIVGRIVSRIIIQLIL